MNGFPKMWNIQKGVWQGAHSSHLMMVKLDDWPVMFALASGKGQEREGGPAVTT